MAQRPTQDFADALALVLSGGLVVNTDIFPGPVRPFLEKPGTIIVPRRAIFVNVLTSAGPTLTFRGGRIQNPNVQFFVRDLDFDAGELLALEVHEKTEDMDVKAIAPLNDYISVIGLDSAPNPLFRNDVEENEWTINVEVKYVRKP